MSGEALVISGLLDDAKRGIVDSACQAVGLEAVSWDLGHAAPEGLMPSLLVAGLAKGARLLPEPVLQAAARFNDAPVLLLAEDALVRPLVMLHGGRVWMVAPPHALETVRSGMMGALAAEGDLGTARVEESGRVSVAETSVGGFWSAVVTPKADTGTGIAHARAFADTRFLAVMSESVAGPELDAIAGRIRSKAAGGIERAIAEGAGMQAAVVCIDKRRWILHWPYPSWYVWLFSRYRLPPCWHPFANNKRSVVTPQRMFTARGADVVLACSRLPEGLTMGPDLVAVAGHGGPALLAMIRGKLEEELAQGPNNAPPFVALIAELRR